MAYITDMKLRNTVDLPIALPDTTLKQSDYLVVATVKLGSGQRLTLTSLALQMLASTVDPSLVDASNLIVPNLSLAYVVLRKDYASGVPGQTGALDYIFLTGVGVVNRSLIPVVLTAPGNYSILVANNTQPSATSAISTSTSIDFKLIVTGQFRLELTVA